MAMRSRSSAWHEASSAAEQPTVSASAIQWGDVPEAAPPSNRVRSTRGGSAADGVFDVAAANVMRGDSRLGRKRQKKGAAVQAVILNPDAAGERCSEGLPAEGGVNLCLVKSGCTGFV